VDDLKSIDKQIKHAEKKIQDWHQKLRKLRAQHEQLLLAGSPDADLAISQVITHQLDGTAPFAADNPSSQYQSKRLMENRTSDGGQVVITTTVSRHSNWQKYQQGLLTVSVEASGTFRNSSATCLKNNQSYYHIKRTKTVKSLNEANESVAKLLQKCQKALKDLLV
jgi:hypothetical protein